MDGYAQFAQTCPDSASGIADACGPGSPDSHRVVWGLTSRPPVPPRAFLRFPVCPPGSPPSPAFPWFPVVRRSPVRPLRPLPRFRFPVGVPPGSLPLSNLHDSAAAGRFRRRWSRAARAKVTNPAATPRLDLAVIRPALQMGSGRARWDAATESPVTSGRERRTPPRPNRPDTAGMCASVLADHGLCSSGRSGGSGASHAASQKGWRMLRVHRHSAARVSVTHPSAACIRRSPRRRKGPRSTARMVAGTSGCSPGIPGAW